MVFNLLRTTKLTLVFLAGQLGDFSLRHQSIAGYSDGLEEEKQAGAEAGPQSEAR